MANNTSGKQKAQATAAVAKGQGKNVAEDAKDQAKDLAQSAQQEAGQLKAEAVDQAKDLAGTVQQRLTAQAGTQKERAAGQARSVADDLHRLVSGEQPQNDAVRQAVAAVADRAEALTQRLETAEPADLVDDVRRFAARRPGTFLAIALGAGLVAGRLTRGLRDAAQDDQALTGARPAYGAPVPGQRRALESEGVQGDVAPHHLESQIPAHAGDDAPRPAQAAAPAVPTLDPVAGGPGQEVPFDQTRPGGQA